jgi:hypothetical protein
LIPDGLLVTVPTPLPAGTTDSMKLGMTLKVAVTLRAVLIVTTQVPVPLHPPPDQPVKPDPELAEAVRVTAVPKANDALHLLLLALQLIPAGLLVICPAPVPASATVRVSVTAVKVADTLSAALIVTLQVPVPLHPAPLHPPKVEPEAGAAVSTTWVPC